jgi:hypothetical protein
VIKHYDPDTIIGLDPGGTTGVAIARNCLPRDKGPVEYESFEMDTSGRDGGKYYGLMRELLRRRDRDGLLLVHIVCEDFDFRQDQTGIALRGYARSKIDYTPAEILGALRVLCAQYSLVLHTQKAAQGKGFWDDDKLKRLGVYNVGHRHGNDAMRHLLYYQCFTLGDERPLFALRATRPELEEQTDD